MLQFIGAEFVEAKKASFGVDTIESPSEWQGGTNVCIGVFMFYSCGDNFSAKRQYSVWALCDDLRTPVSLVVRPSQSEAVV